MLPEHPIHRVIIDRYPQLSEITPATLQEPFVRSHNLVHQLDPAGNKIGAICHSPMWPNQPCLIVLAAIDFAPANMHSASQALEVLSKRAFNRDVAALLLKETDEDIKRTFWFPAGFFPLQRNDIPRGTTGQIFGAYLPLHIDTLYDLHPRRETDESPAA